MRNYLLALVAGWLVILGLSYVWEHPTPYATYLQSQADDVVLTHDEALKLCDDAGLIYDYEAEGYTTFELCYE